MENFYGKMEEFTKVNGNMVNNMELDTFYKMKDPKREKENGMKGKE